MKKLMLATALSLMTSVAFAESNSYVFVWHKTTPVNVPVNLESEHTVVIKNKRGHNEIYPFSFTLQSGEQRAFYSGKVEVRSHGEAKFRYKSNLGVQRDTAGVYPIVAITEVGGDSKSSQVANAVLTIN